MAAAPARYDLTQTALGSHAAARTTVFLPPRLVPSVRPGLLDVGELEATGRPQDGRAGGMAGQRQRGSVDLP